MAAVHVRAATEAKEPIDVALLDRALEVLHDALMAAPLASVDRPFARALLARVLGHKGEQQAALDALDEAIAELAHLGSPLAKVLMTNRDLFAAGEWFRIDIGAQA